jgi:hypothetical protein
MKKPLMVKLQYLTLVFVYALLGYFGYLLFWPSGVAVYNNAPFPVINKEIAQGERLLYVVDYCKPKDIPVTVSRELIDGIVYNLPSYESNFPSGCHKVISDRLEIPDHILPGEYRLRLSVTFHVNKIRKIVKVVETEPFKVYAKESEN